MYCNSRFGADWCLTPEESIAVHSGSAIIPQQVIVRVRKGSNSLQPLLHQLALVFPSMVPMKRGILKTGDYSVSGYEEQFTIERKSLQDLVHTIIHERDRFERELERMRSYNFRRLLVTAPYATVVRGGYQFSMANPRSVIASINTFEMRYRVPTVFAANPEEVAQRVIDWTYYYIRGMSKRAGPT